MVRWHRDSPDPGSGSRTIPRDSIRSSAPRFEHVDHVVPHSRLAPASGGGGGALADEAPPPEASGPSRVRFNFSVHVVEAGRHVTEQIEVRPPKKAAGRARRRGRAGLICPPAVRGQAAIELHARPVDPAAERTATKWALDADAAAAAAAAGGGAAARPQSADSQLHVVDSEAMESLLEAFVRDAGLGSAYNVRPAGGGWRPGSNVA